MLEVISILAERRKVQSCSWQEVVDWLVDHCSARLAICLLLSTRRSTSKAKVLPRED